MSLILKLYSDVILITKVHDLFHILVEYKGEHNGQTSESMSSSLEY